MSMDGTVMPATSSSGWATAAGRSSGVVERTMPRIDATVIGFVTGRRRIAHKPSRDAVAPAMPGPVLTATVPPRPRDLVRDYVRHVGGDPSSYKNTVPPHLFPQWMFPLQTRALEGIHYPMAKVLNAGCKLTVRGPTNKLVP